MATASNLQQTRSYLLSHKQSLVEGLKELLAIPSISTDPQYKEAIYKAHDWIFKTLKQMGFTTQSIPTCRYPVILAKMHVSEHLPTVLIYNHYDVQPVDPIELWDHPPFEPYIDENDEIYARGAQDNKGQFWAVICALKALLAHDKRLPCNVILCVEGEEESGSTGLNSVLDQIKDQIQAQTLLIVDVDVPSVDKPAVTLGARGNVSMTLELRGSKSDLHSGLHGGIVYNPNHALVELLSKLRAADGTILIDGFYDDVLRPSKDERELIDFSFDSSAYEQKFKAKPCGGEKRFLPLESCWLRPTLEINGLSGGYSGEGFKTVIPAKAIAKISCRLVANQDPVKILKAVKDKILSLVPDGIEATLQVHGSLGWARSNLNSSSVAAVRQAYEEVFGVACKSVFSGGSIPITASLAKACQADVIFMGYGLSDDNIHAPNEHYGIQRLTTLACVIARSLELIAQNSKV